MAHWNGGRWIKIYIHDLHGFCTTIHYTRRIWSDIYEVANLETQKKFFTEP